MTFFRSMRLLVLSLLVITSALEAREFTRVGATKGLEARVVPSLLVDHEGFLWVGSREGLYRFDGYQATAFHPDARLAGQISDLDIRVVYEDGNGDIWVGTNTGGLNRYDRGSGQFTTYRHDSGRPDSLPDDNIYSITEGPEGAIWVATQQGLGRFDQNSATFRRFRHEPDDPLSLANDWAFHLYLSPSGTLWITTVGGGLNRWNPESESFTRYDLQAMTGDAGKLNDVFTVHETPDGIVWAGTREGLVVLDSNAGTARYFDMGRVEGFRPLITSSLADGEGRLWLTTMIFGVLIVDLAKETWSRISELPLGEPGNLPAQPQMSLARFRDQVFIGTWGEGIFRTTLYQPPFLLFDLNNTDGGLRNNNITALLGTSDVGLPWVGSFGGGPQRLSVTESKAVERLEDQLGIRTAGVLDLVDLPGQGLFAATTAGLYQVDKESGASHLQSHEPGNPASFGEGYLYALLPGEDDGLWVGGGGSGLYFRDARGELSQFRHDPDDPDSLSGDFITDLAAGGPGYIWVGTRSNGLNRCRTEPFACERLTGQLDDWSGLSHFHVTDLHRDRRGRLWIATDGGGINRVIQDGAGNVTGMLHFGSEDGLLNDGVMAIEEDVDESLWLSTRHGLSRINPATESVINFVTESGLPASHYNNGASSADAEYIYFGSVDGVLAFRRGSLLEERDPAPVNLTRVRTAAPGQQPGVVDHRPGELRIPYGDVLSIEFASFDYSESSHEYAYRLHPDDAWTALGAQPQIIFHGLEPGSYQFQARGRDVYGLWGQSEVLNLVIIPPFWMTPWFRLLLVLLVAAAAVALHLMRSARLQRSAREVQRLSERRESALERRLGSEAELSVLTPRQKEILQLIAEGYSTREIAGLLDVSIKTVEAHRANLMERLEIYDVPGLVRLAIRAGLVSPHE